MKSQTPETTFTVCFLFSGSSWCIIGSFSFSSALCRGWYRKLLQRNMSDRVALPLPSGNVQTRVFRSNSFNPPPPLGCHRSRRTLSLPSREKPLIPPVISENPECSRQESEQYRQELLTTPQPQQPQILIDCCEHEVGEQFYILGWYRQWDLLKFRARMHAILSSILCRKILYIQIALRSSLTKFS